MGKLRKLLLLMPFVFAFMFFSVSADENNVTYITVDVSVRDDGSAYFSQNWIGDFYDGTEVYIPISDKDIKISDITVSDGHRDYTYKENWDINADFDSKKNMYGINRTDDGIEICFGISEYGHNSYRIEYVVTDFIKSYTDADGVNFMFVNPGMSTFPTSATVAIRLENQNPLSEENAKIWGFGYLGDVVFSDGEIVAETSKDLDGEACMIVLVRLDKGVITPAASVSESFQNVIDKAIEDSDYDGEEDDDEFYGGFYRFMLCVALISGLLVVYFYIKRKREIRKFYNEANYFRDVPNGGKIEVSQYLAKTFDITKEDSLIIGALLLRMINSGCIEPVTTQNVGAFGRIKSSVDLKLMREPDGGIEKRLYSVLVSASGEDGILQEKELEKYAYKNPKSVKDIIDTSLSDGRDKFIKSGGFVKGEGRCIKDLSDAGKREFSEVAGLKKYLDDFSLISEREINETLIWKDYMVYATLFGIADKVIEQFKKVYPENIPEFDSYGQNIVIANSYCRGMHQSAERAIQQARSSGLGGSASYGGGGGFSGGGRGGGTR